MLSERSVEGREKERKGERRDLRRGGRGEGKIRAVLSPLTQRTI